MTKKILLILILLYGAHNYALAQHTEQEDSSRFYKDLENLAKKNKVTKLIHKVFFKTVAVPPKPIIKKGKKPKSRAKLKSVYYTKFEGKPIRDVIITTLDPFGYKLNDTTVSPRGVLQKSGNTLHIKTRLSAVRNLLLFRTNQPFDSLFVKESERLIRTQSYVREVTIYPVAAGKKSDSVDVFVRVLDLWSIVVNVGTSLNKTIVDITERNFLGLGHRFENGFPGQFKTGEYAYQSNYLVPTIANTYISARLEYLISEQKLHSTSLDIERPFYSAFTKWAWGATFIEQSYHDFPDTVPDNSFKSFTQDYWGGRAYQIFKGNSEEKRSTNFVLAARYTRLHYIEKPYTYYSDDNTYLVSAGLSTRKYRQDTYIFNYSVTEDVPVGRAYNITTGFQNNVRQWYLGLRAAWGNYYHWGYISTHLEYGTFLNGSKTGVFSGEINYFTGLFQLGKWKFRQFIKPQLTLGIRKPEKITLTNEFGILGFTADSITGTRRAVVLLQTQSYAPWRILGFRFGPYFICALGMIGDDANGFKKSRLYAEYGLGVLIKNDYLVLNTFQFSLNFYPIIPGAGSNIFKTNRYRTYYYGLRDFDIGKPSIISYQ